MTIPTPDDDDGAEDEMRRTLRHKRFPSRCIRPDLPDHRQNDGQQPPDPRILATMTVGEYAGVPLQDPGDTWRHGAVFLLRKPALRDGVVSLDGWTTSVVGKAAITCGPSSATKFGDTFSAALAAANNGLDLMCATGMANCAIISAADESLVWWPQRRSGGTVMRATIVQTFQSDVRATAVVQERRRKCRALTRR